MGAGPPRRPTPRRSRLDPCAKRRNARAPATITIAIAMKNTKIRNACPPPDDVAEAVAGAGAMVAPESLAPAACAATSCSSVTTSTPSGTTVFFTRPPGTFGA